MSILNVVNRVFVGFFSCQSQVEIQLAVDGAHYKEETSCISTNFFNQFVQGYALTGAFGHFNQFAIAVQAYHLQDKHFQLVRMITQCANCCFHTSNVTVVVSAPQIDYSIKTTSIFIAMVSDIRCKVSRNTIVTDYYAVFIVAIFSSFKPQSAILFIQVAAFGKQIASTFNCISIVQGLFTEPVVISYIECFQVFFQRSQFFFQSNGAELLQAFFFTHIEESITIDTHNAFCSFNNIVTMVAVFRELYGLTKLFQITSIYGSCQIIDLVTSVIDVEFAANIHASCFHQVCQSTTNSSTAAMTYMQRTSGVSTYIFYLDFFFAIAYKVAVIFAFSDNASQYIINPILFQIEIDEARACNFHFFYISTVHIIYNCLSNHTGIAFQSASRLHSEVGCKITKLFLGRYFQQYLRQFAAFNSARINCLLCRSFNSCSQNLFNVHLLCPPQSLLKSSYHHRVVHCGKGNILFLNSRCLYGTLYKDT